VGSDQGVGRAANIHSDVMQHDVFQIHRFALDPERGAGFRKMRSGDPAFARRAPAGRSSSRASAPSA